jgi:hypothetical protein
MAVTLYVEPAVRYHRGRLKDVFQIGDVCLLGSEQNCSRCDEQPRTMVSRT